MSNRIFRCGSSNDVYQANRVKPRATPATPREDRAEVRLRTRLHFAGVRSVGHTFRVVAALADGCLALVCLGGSRQEVLELAREQARCLPPLTVALRLEQWVGGSRLGDWRALSCRRGELPRIRRPRLRRSRLAGRSDQA